LPFEDLGYDEAYLLVGADNAAAIGLYLSSGFSPVLEGAEEEAQWRGIVGALRPRRAPPAPVPLETTWPTRDALPPSSAASGLPQGVDAVTDSWAAAVTSRAAAVAAAPAAFLVDASKSFAVCGLAAIVYSAAVLLPREDFVSWAADALTERHGGAAAVATGSSAAAVAAANRFEAKQQLHRCFREAHRAGPAVIMDDSATVTSAVDHALCWALAEALRSHHLPLFEAQLVRPNPFMLSRASSTHDS